MGGGGGGAMSGRAAATALGKVTWILAAGFIATSITLTILAASGASTSSVIDQIGGSAPADPAPAIPASPLGNDLLPPVSSDAPAAPPRATD
jgi:preprotein translocase subunit SecG